MATLWPFAPSTRRAPYVVTREYRTDIIVSRSGREQARALRQTPRKRIEYMAGETADCLRSFERSMVNAQRTELIIPDRTRYVSLAVELSSGGTSITADPLPEWITEGATLVLTDKARHALRTVVSIIGTTVTFLETDALAWPIGSRVSPALLGYLSSSIPTPILSRQRGIIDVDVTFEVNPGEELPEDAGSPSATLGGREVFLTPPNRWRSISLNRVQEGVGAVDFGFGRVSRFFPIEFSTRMWEATYIGCDVEHSDELRKFFDRMKGRLGEFYMPTWLPDMVPVSGVTAAGTTLTVSGTEVDTVYSNDTVYKAVAILKNDGTWLTRTVTNITNSGGNSVLTVGSAWGVTVALVDIKMVCWLPVWRFASDSMSMSWERLYRNPHAEVKMPFQMLETLAVEA